MIDIDKALLVFEKKMKEHLNERESTSVSFFC